MSVWDKKSKIIVQDDEGSNIAVKNRFPPSGTGASQSLPTILTRLQTGLVEYESLIIIVCGVGRQDVPVLMTGSRVGLASERDMANGS